MKRARRRADDPAAHRCPACRSNDVMRVPRKTARDHLARLVGWRVYRCSECQARFYDRPTSTGQAA